MILLAPACLSARNFPRDPQVLAQASQKSPQATLLSGCWLRAASLHLVLVGSLLPQPASQCPAQGPRVQGRCLKVVGGKGRELRVMGDKLSEQLWGVPQAGQSKPVATL